MERGKEERKGGRGREGGGEEMGRGYGGHEYIERLSW